MLRESCLVRALFYFEHKRLNTCTTNESRYLMKRPDEICITSSSKQECYVFGEIVKGLTGSDQAVLFIPRSCLPQ